MGLRCVKILRDREEAIYLNRQLTSCGVYVLCEDMGVIGSMFFVMEFLEGRIFKDKYVLPLQTALVYTTVHSTLY